MSPPGSPSAASTLLLVWASACVRGSTSSSSSSTPTLNGRAGIRAECPIAALAPYDVAAMAARRLGLALAAAAGILALSAALAARTVLGNDYGLSRVGTDGAGPQINALVHVDLHRFFVHESFLGPVSLVLRAPFAALSNLGHPNLLEQYRLGSFPCLAAIGLAGAATVVLTRERRGGWWHAAVLVGVVLLGPPVQSALGAGHPEELLTAALMLLAIAAAALGHDRTAAVLLGLAIASKPWAALAIGPVAVASHNRVRVAAAGLALGAALIAPMALANTPAFAAAMHGAADIHHVRPLSVWWWLSAHRGVTPSGIHMTARRLPRLIVEGMRPAILLGAGLLSLAVARAKRSGVETALLLAALIFMARCVLDPANHAYYEIPFIATLGAWEVVGARRPPALALVASLLLAQRFRGMLAPDNDLIASVYLAWSLPLAGYLAYRLRRA
jgi:hypothetical protein